MKQIFILIASGAILFASASSFAQDNSATPSAVTPVCEVSGEGVFRGAWMKHRILIGDEVVYAANNVGSILKALESLRSQGYCR